MQEKRVLTTVRIDADELLEGAGTLAFRTEIDHYLAGFSRQERSHGHFSLDTGTGRNGLQQRQGRISIIPDLESVYQHRVTPHRPAVEIRLREGRLLGQDSGRKQQQQQGQEAMHHQN